MKNYRWEKKLAKIPSLTMHKYLKLHTALWWVSSCMNIILTFWIRLKCLYVRLKLIQHEIQCLFRIWIQLLNLFRKRMKIFTLLHKSYFSYYLSYKIKLLWNSEIELGYSISFAYRIIFLSYQLWNATR